MLEFTSKNLEWALHHTFSAGPDASASGPSNILEILTSSSLIVRLAKILRTNGLRRRLRLTKIWHARCIILGT